LTPFTRRIHQAIDLAARAHAGQVRKDPDVEIPYVAHVCAVAYLLAEHGFSEDVVIAGFLHDVLEDRPEFASQVGEFGQKVVELIRQVSERKVDGQGKIPWKQRKAAYIAHLRTAPPDAKAISCADKIHNMESLLMALERGADVWSSLSAPRHDQLARFEALREALATGWDHPLLGRYDVLFSALREKLGEEPAQGGGT